MKVELTQEELGQAIVQFAAAKAGVSGNFRHSVKMNAVIMTIATDQPLIEVTLEPLHVSSGGSA